MSDQVASAYCEPDEHYFASNGVANCPIWVKQCMRCGKFDGKDLNAQLAQREKQAMLRQRAYDERELIEPAVREFAERVKQNFTGSNTGKKSEQIRHIEYSGMTFTGEEVAGVIEAQLRATGTGEETNTN